MIETTQKVYIVTHNNHIKSVYLYFIHMSTRSQKGSLNCSIRMQCCPKTCTVLWPAQLFFFPCSQPHFRMQPLEFTSFWCCIACLLLPLKSVACFLESLHIQCCGTTFVIKDERDKPWNEVVVSTQDPGRCPQMSYKWASAFSTSQDWVEGYCFSSCLAGRCGWGWEE